MTGSVVLQEVSSGSVRRSPTDGVKFQILNVAYELWCDAGLTGSPVSALAIAPLCLQVHLGSLSLGEGVNLLAAPPTALFPHPSIPTAFSLAWLTLAWLNVTSLGKTSLTAKPLFLCIYHFSQWWDYL